MLNRNCFALSAVLVLFSATLLTAVTPVVITSTFTTYSTHVLTVYGSGFSTGATPTFVFNGHTLAVKGFTNTSIAATLPSTTNQGNYQVTIRNSQGQSATVSTAYDVDAADVDPALVTNSTLKGSGTKASPLGVAVPLVLNNNATDDTVPVITVGYGSINIQEGTLSVGFSPQGPALSGHGWDGQFGVVGTGVTGVYGVGCCAGQLSFYGVVGDSGQQPSAYGIHGIAGFNQDEYAGYFEGNVNITGKLTKAGGSFKIDHPLDPANKYLSHSFVESPDMMNVYNGNVFTDGTGNATVTLPDWFEALNRDFRYQLTVIGAFAQATIAQEVTHNQFIIRTDKPSVKVSWQITGIRQDAWANANRIPVEEDKPEKERDSYLHPALFNKPPEKSIEWARHPQAKKKLAEQRAKMMQNATQHTATLHQAQQ
jgi:hypothetical protein